MRKIAAYTSFSIVYLIVGLAISLIGKDSDMELVAFIAGIVSSLIAAPIAILLAQRITRLSSAGLLTSSTTLAIAIYVVVWAIYRWGALAAGGEVPFWRPAQLGGWQLAVSAVVIVVAPVLWLQVLRRRETDLVSRAAA